MKIPSNYKPADDGGGSTLLTGAQSYSESINQYLKEQQTKRQLFMDAIFCPDWDRLSARPSGTIQSLVAQSIGLVPELAKPDVIELHALPYFDARGDLLRVNILKAFLRRLSDAKENIAPLGDLKPIAGYEDNEAPRFRSADFIELAKRMQWEMPEEFIRFRTTATGPRPEAVDGGADSLNKAPGTNSEERVKAFNRAVEENKIDIERDTLNTMHIVLKRLDSELWPKSFDGFKDWREKYLPELKLKTGRKRRQLR